MNKHIKQAAAVLAAGLLAMPAFAAQETFNLAWSGASFGNSATATGKITLDTDAFSADSISFPDSRVTNLTVTVSGAGSGNGTFDLSDFGSMYIWTPSSLDYSKELVGQSLTNGGTWGTSNGSDGDFNLFANNALAPDGTWYFELSTGNGSGDVMALTSMSAVPEAQNVSMMLAGICLVGFAARRRKARA